MKISKKDKKTIGEIVKKLPPMSERFKTETVTISGHALLAEGKQQFRGEAIVPHQRYLTTQKAQVNHKTKAEAAFKLAGYDGVHSYVKGVVDACAKAKPNG